MYFFVVFIAFERRMLLFFFYSVSLLLCVLRWFLSALLLTFPSSSKKSPPSKISDSPLHSLPLFGKPRMFLYRRLSFQFICQGYAEGKTPKIFEFHFQKTSRNVTFDINYSLQTPVLIYMQNACDLKVHGKVQIVFLIAQILKSLGLIFH